MWSEGDTTTEREDVRDAPRRCLQSMREVVRQSGENSLISLQEKKKQKNSTTIEGSCISRNKSCRPSMCSHRPVAHSLDRSLAAFHGSTPNQRCCKNRRFRRRPYHMGNQTCFATNRPLARVQTGITCT